jgi:hypothetical protein
MFAVEVVAVEALLAVQVHCAQGGTYGPCARSEDRVNEEHLSVLCQTRLENSGTNGSKTRMIWVGRVRIAQLFWWRPVTSVPYSLLSQMAKFELDAFLQSSARTLHKHATCRIAILAAYCDN